MEVGERFDHLSQDLRFALRGLRRSPGFTGVATLSLAIGIGLSAATFAIVDSMLNPKIPIAGIDRLFRANLRFGNQRNPPPPLEQVRALQALPGVERVGMMGFDGVPHVIIANGVQSIPQPSIMRYTPSFFATIGVTTAMGRFPSDDEVRAKSVVVLNNSAWRSMFPKRDSLAGATIAIDGQDYPVVGVLPPGLESLIYGRVWIPAASRSSTCRACGRRWSSCASPPRPIPSGFVHSSPPSRPTSPQRTRLRRRRRTSFDWRGLSPKAPESS